MTVCRCTILLAVVWGLATVRADVLIGTNHERLVGQIVAETAESVTFESELGGRLIIPRAKVKEIQRSAPPPPANDWKPPGVGRDGYDWLQLKSGEWLRGWLRYVEDKRVEFDSDELEEMTLKLKNVRCLYTAKPMYAQFEKGLPIQGAIVVSNQAVFVATEEYSRGDLIGITPSGRTGMRHWSGKFRAGLNLRAGNTESVDLSVNGELSRRTPNSDLEFSYLGNFAEVNGVEDQNNHRVSTFYDIRLGRHWFVIPMLAEYFRDPLANLAHRVTAGVGAGYYVFDQDELEWKLGAGPAFQHTQFETVETSASNDASTPAAVVQSYFRTDVTRSVDLSFSYQGIFTESRAGLYSHHSVVELEYEIKRHLDLNVAFVWDYLQNPQEDSSSQIPKRSDLKLTLGLGLRF